MVLKNESVMSSHGTAYMLFNALTEFCDTNDGQSTVSVCGSATSSYGTYGVRFSKDTSDLSGT